MAKYQFINDYTLNYFNSSIGKNAVKTFRKDDFIEGTLKSSGGVGMPDSIVTTIDGKMPTNTVGQIIIEVPVNGNLATLDGGSPSSPLNKEIGGYPVKSYLLAVVIIGTIWYLVKRK
jgi:hypothetical protein